VQAVRSGGQYKVRYPDAVLVLWFPQDADLSQEAVAFIQAALLESR